MANALEAASLVMIPSGYEDGTLGSLKPTDGSGDFTFSRGSNLSATRINEQGYIEKGYENLLLQSNSFTASNWYRPFTNTPIGNQAGYNGSNDAWLIEKAGNGQVSQSISYSGVGTFSVYVKGGSYNFVILYVAALGGRYFELSGEGNIGLTFAGTPIDSKIELIGNDWYKCSISFSGSISDLRIYPAESNGVLGTSGSIYIQDAMLNQGMVAYPYVETTTAPVAGGILEDMPRLDYSNGSCPSLLLEPSRTNTFGNSEYFGSGSSGLVTLEANSTTSPDGTQNASRIVSSQTASGVKFVDFDGVSPSASDDQVFSLFVKKYNHRYIQLIDNGDADLYANFDVEDGVIGNYGSGTTASIEDYGNGWYRCSIVCDGSQNINNRNRVYLVDSLTQGYANATNVASGDGVYIWGAMQENNASYPTSYIPTYGVSQTRLADSVTDAGDVNTFNSTEGVLYAEMSALANDGTYRLIDISGVSSGDRIFLAYTNSDNRIRVVLRVANIAQFDYQYTLNDATEFNKIAFKYKENDFSLWVNGTKVYTDSSGITFPLDTLNVINFSNAFGSEKLFGKIKQVLYFPTALSDSECIALTTI